MRNEGPNFLLWGFVLVSIGIHALLFYHFGRMPGEEKEIRIEVEMGRTSRPPARTIPRPPPQPEVPAPDLQEMAPEMPAEIPDLSVDPPRFAPEPPREYSPDLPDLPDLDADPQLPVAEWQGKEETASDDSGSEAAYFARVRFAIEKEKQYPTAARKRRLEGRVLVRFTIGADGALSGLSLVEGSRYATIDEAALAAVRAAAPFPPPPAELFNGALDLTVPMTFELVD